MNQDDLCPWGTDTGLESLTVSRINTPIKSNMPLTASARNDQKKRIQNMQTLHPQRIKTGLHQSQPKLDLNAKQKQPPARAPATNFSQSINGRANTANTTVSRKKSATCISPSNSKSTISQQPPSPSPSMLKAFETTRSREPISAGIQRQHRLKRMSLATQLLNPICSNRYQHMRLKSESDSQRLKDQVELQTMSMESSKSYTLAQMRIKKSILKTVELMKGFQTEDEKKLSPTIFSNNTHSHFRPKKQIQQFDWFAVKNIPVNRSHDFKYMSTLIDK